MRKREYNNGKIRKMKAIREGRAVSLRDLARAIDVNYTTISHWENGKRTPERENVEKLEKFFKLNIEELMAEDEEYYGEVK